MKENLIIPMYLKRADNLKILDTEKDIRNAEKEFQELTRREFQEMRVANLKALEEAATCYID